MAEHTRLSNINEIVIKWFQRNGTVKWLMRSKWFAAPSACNYCEQNNLFLNEFHSNYFITLETITKKNLKIKTSSEILS